MNGHNRPLIKPKKRLVSKLIPSYKAIVQKSTDRVITVSLKKQTNSLTTIVHFKLFIRKSKISKIFENFTFSEN